MLNQKHPPPPSSILSSSSSFSSSSFSSSSSSSSTLLMHYHSLNDGTIWARKKVTYKSLIFICHWKKNPPKHNNTIVNSFLCVVSTVHMVTYYTMCICCDLWPLSANQRGWKSHVISLYANSSSALLFQHVRRKKSPMQNIGPLNKWILIRIKSDLCRVVIGNGWLF